MCVWCKIFMSYFFLLPRHKPNENLWFLWNISTSQRATTWKMVGSKGMNDGFSLICRRLLSRWYSTLKMIKASSDMHVSDCIIASWHSYLIILTHCFFIESMPPLSRLRRRRWATIFPHGFEINQIFSFLLHRSSVWYRVFDIITLAAAWYSQLKFKLIKSRKCHTFFCSD